MSDKNEDKISRKLNVHSPVNPPSGGFGIDAKINLTNKKFLTITNWKKSTHPSFTLEITNPISLGLPDFQESNVENFFDSVILSCNLVLIKAALSKHSSDSSHTKIQRKKEPPIPSKVEDTPTGKKVTIQEVIRITESVSISIGFEDELDESKVIEVLNKLLKIENGNVSSNLNIQDLQKALREYNSGTTNFERLGIFKHLFSSVELATNCDGNDRRSSQLDNEINRISGIELSKIEDFRKFNSRTKHIDRHFLHRSEYKEGMSKLGEKIIFLRECAQKIILEKLSTF